MRWTRPSRSMIVNLVLVLTAFGLLGAAIASKWDTIRDVLSRPIDRGAFGAAFGLYLLGLLLTFTRWYILVRTLQIPFRPIDALRLGFVGNVFNLVIPGAVGGDVIKAVFLARARPDRKAASIASMVIDRLLGLAGLFLLAGIAGVFAFGRAPSQARILIVTTWVALVCGLIGLAVIFTPKLYPFLERFTSGKPKLAHLLHELERAASSYRDRIGVVVGCLLFSTLIHSIYVVAFYLASRAIFESIPSFSEHLLMVPLVLFTTAVPLPFGALGLTENASGVMFQLVGHPDGAVAMMAFRVLMYAGGVVSSLVYLANFRQIRDLRTQEAPAPAPLEL
ncbi:MAG: lysylphosphatidylglycerol synthase transmembrane domain-containing protein [Isosphaeraceae bacterium]|nr:lysylphosphatidylglycerol synthase transmembrane domain-containing protein [Isosphaeraceae bacterium]